MARQALDSTKTLGSYLVIRQLADLKPLLAPYRTTDAVAEFLSCLNEALMERQWLYRWLKDSPGMTSERPLYERDPQAWQAHLAEGNARQARKRVSADALLRDASGRILLVDPKYKPDWDLPGGMAEANEPPARAVQRELREELGLDIRPGRLLCVDWVSPHGPWDDLVNFIFDGGSLSENEIRCLRPHDDEIRACEFFHQGQAEERLRPHAWRRVSMALNALAAGTSHYLHDGHTWPPGPAQA